MSDIGERLAELRRKRNLNQEELAEKLGVSRQAVSKWERGESTPDISNLIALSELYEVSIDFLAKGKEEDGIDSEVRIEEAIPIDDSHEEPAFVFEESDGDIGFEWDPPDPESIIDAIPVDGHFQETEQKPVAIEKKRRSPWLTLPYPFIVAIVYLFIGFSSGGWHPWWILFLTIPIYYWVAQVITNDSEYIEDHPQYSK